MKKWNKGVIISLVGCILLNPMSVYALTKNETIYTSLDATGNVTTSSVTNHLFIHDQKEFEDETELKEILNINGKETFTLNSNVLKWKTNGNDIFYRGKTDKEQPIDVEVEYYLDGEKKNVKDMIGKKGSIKLVFHFQNHLNHQVNINGKKETIYTPFVVSIGMILNNQYNKNISVENGKWVDSGSRSMVIGLATPGVYESLHVESLKGLNTVTVSYDTTKFSMGNVYMVATPKVLEEKDLSVFEKLEQVTSNMSILQQSMNQIEEGVKKLETGSSALLKGTNDLSVNLDKAMNSITALKNGSIQLEKGITTLLSVLTQTRTELNSKVVTSKSQLNMLKKGNETAIMNILKPLGGITFEQLYVKYKDIVNLTTVIDPTDPEASIKSAYQLVLLLKQNNAAMEEMERSLDEIVSNMDFLIDSVKPLQNIHSLSNGLHSLETGMKQLSVGVHTLKNGEKELNDGIITLHGGVTKMNREGINPLYTYSNMIRSYSNKIEAMTKLSQEYCGYATNNADNTMFIYMMKSVK